MCKHGVCDYQFVESEKSDIGWNGPEQTHQMTLLKIVQTLNHFVTAKSNLCWYFNWQIKYKV